ncbi:MAG: TraR/DksA C4-type zinc finger protein [Anaerolineae bacterium]
MTTVGLRGRSQIYEELERVQAQAEKFSIQLRQGSDSRGDDADNANDLMERAKAIALCQYLWRKHRELVHAEKRVAQGLANVCEDCGQPIETARLDTLVGVTRCVRCQRRAEQEARRSRSYAA